MPPLRSAASTARPRTAAHASAAIYPHPAAILRTRSTLAAPSCHAREAKVEVSKAGEKAIYDARREPERPGGGGAQKSV